MEIIVSNLQMYELAARPGIIVDRGVVRLFHAQSGSVIGIGHVPCVLHLLDKPAAFGPGVRPTGIRGEVANGVIGHVIVVG